MLLLLNQSGTVCSFFVTVHIETFILLSGSVFSTCQFSIIVFCHNEMILTGSSVM